MNENDTTISVKDARKKNIIQSVQSQ